MHVEVPKRFIAEVQNISGCAKAYNDIYNKTNSVFGSKHQVAMRTFERTYNVRLINIPLDIDVTGVEFYSPFFNAIDFKTEENQILCMLKW